MIGHGYANNKFEYVNPGDIVLAICNIHPHDSKVKIYNEKEIIIQPPFLVINIVQMISCLIPRRCYKSIEVQYGMLVTKRILIIHLNTQKRKSKTKKGRN